MGFIICLEQSMGLWLHVLCRKALWERYVCVLGMEEKRSYLWGGKRFEGRKKSASSLTDGPGA